jgi:hypothetical protein
MRATELMPTHPALFAVSRSRTVPHNMLGSGPNRRLIGMLPFHARTGTAELVGMRRPPPRFSAGSGQARSTRHTWSRCPAVVGRSRPAGGGDLGVALTSGGFPRPTRACALRWPPCGSPAQATYDLRRPRLKGFIERVPGTNTYRVTGHGLHMASFFTDVAARVVVPAVTDLARLGPPPLVGPGSAHRNVAQVQTRTGPPLKRGPLAA